MKSKKVAKRKDNPVYTQQDDTDLLESTGTNPPDADPAQSSNQTGNEGKSDSHLPNVHKDASEEISKKDDEEDGQSEQPDERDEDRRDDA